MISSLLFPLVLGLPLVPRGVPDDLLQRREHWELRGTGVRFEQVLGRPALRLGTGMAVFREVDFQDGVIELDVRTTGQRSFVGLAFRIQSAEEYERIYLRPHESRLWDALQYTPVNHGMSAWQLYSGPGYTAAAEIPSERWFSVRVVVTGSRAEVYLDGATRPDLVVTDLARGSAAGRVGIWSKAPSLPGGEPSPNAVSNLRVQLAEPVAASPRALPPPGAGFLIDWELSAPFATGGEPGGSPPIDPGGWRSIRPDARGIVNVAEHVAFPDDASSACVLARTRLFSESARDVQLDLGFSDAVSVFLDGELVFRGDNTAFTRNPRFLGSLAVDATSLHLEIGPGESELTLAVSERFGGWGFAARIDPPLSRADGRPAPAHLPDPAIAAGAVVFADDFESGLANWEVSDPRSFAIVESGDPAHGKVLQLSPHGPRPHALMRDSQAWPAYRIEGQMRFPRDGSSYLGWIYNLTRRDGRTDMGSIYVKGNGSYVRVNPRRDWNPTRNLYEEYRVPLTGERAVVIGRWQPFAAEVIGNVCHFYAVDLETPAVTFDLYESSSGKAGFKPRVVGVPVWVDDVRVSAIHEFTHDGPPQPRGVDHRPESLHTDWELSGPFEAGLPELEGHFALGDWRPFPADSRGAVLTGRVVDFTGPRSVAYFRTRIAVDAGESVELQINSIDAFALWVDDAFWGYPGPSRFAHHDFGRNPAHPPTDRIPLGPGVHDVVLRVRGGQYATGGFFARVVEDAE